MAASQANSESRLQAGRFDSGDGVDSLLVLSVVLLSCLGLVMVYSATVASDSSTLEINYHHLIRHLIHLGLGVVLLLVAASVRLDWLQKAADQGHSQAGLELTELQTPETDEVI